MTDARLSDDGRILTVCVPMTFAKRGGRKSVISPEGVPTVMSLRPRVDSTLVKALARAFRWRKLIETGVYATIDEMAAAEKISASYVCRVLRLTLLAPDIVDAILDGRQPAGMKLAVLMRPFPAAWKEQLQSFLVDPCDTNACVTARRSVGQDTGAAHDPKLTFARDPSQVVGHMKTGADRHTDLLHEGKQKGRLACLDLQRA